jgi:hypothetical protein
VSDLRDLPDLARAVRERVVVPPYDVVSRRVRARRLRGAAGSLAAAVLVVGGFAVWQNVATTAAPVPQPAEPTPVPPADESWWRSVVNGTDSHPFEIEGTADGAIAVVWRALEQPEPTFAIVIREADGTVHGTRIGQPVELTPVPGGWVGTYSSRAWFIASDGSQWRGLGVVASSRGARVGDTFVRGEYASWLYSSDEGTLVPIPQAYGDIADGYVTSDGYLLTCAGAQDGVRATDSSDSRDGSPLIPGATCVMAGNGNQVAIVGLGDDSDGGIPMTGLLLRSGSSWTVPHIIDFPGGVTSVAVTPTGTTVVTNASDGDSLVVGADRDTLPPDMKAGEAFVAGDRLYVSSYGFANGPLFYSEDDGRAWHEDVLPGNESKSD